MQVFRLLPTLFVTTALSLMLFACGQETTTAPQDSSETSEPPLADPSISDSEVVASADQILPSTPTSQTSQSPTDDQQDSTNKNALFDEFEFSTVEEASIEEQNEVSQEPYCLDGHSDNPQTTKMIRNACMQISNRLASVSNQTCLDANLVFSQCLSVNQFPILYSEFPPLENKTPQGRILVIGGTHGDELTSVSMLFRWIEKLNKYHSGLFHWHLVPMMNPDGVLIREASRTNANGVDLNRNMPSNDWQENALKYWREKTNENARRYPGEMASSEPETKWLVDEINSFKPDAIISVHAPYGVVDFDAQVLNAAPKNLGRLLLNLLGTYPGSLGNYAGINRNIPVITLELPHAWVMPTESETTELWEDIVSWLSNNINNSELAEQQAE